MEGKGKYYNMSNVESMSNVCSLIVVCLYFNILNLNFALTLRGTFTNLLHSVGNYAVLRQFFSFQLLKLLCLIFFDN